MEILCDTNVVLNSLTGREDPFLESCDEIFRIIASGTVRAWIAFHSLSTIWYVLRKVKSEQDTRSLMEYICDTFEVAAASHEQIVQAVRNHAFLDFEDCLQDECAIAVNAQYLVTCNIKDFGNSKTPALTPTQFLDIAKAGT